MKVLDNGDYQLDNGKVIPASEIGKAHQKAPKSESLKPKESKPQELSEGQSSGVIRLED
jgi:hypothetical protein